MLVLAYLGALQQPEEKEVRAKRTTSELWLLVISPDHQLGVVGCQRA